MSTHGKSSKEFIQTKPGAEAEFSLHNIYLKVFTDLDFQHEWMPMQEQSMCSEMSNIFWSTKPHLATRFGSKAEYTKTWRKPLTSSHNWEPNLAWPKTWLVTVFQGCPKYVDLRNIRVDNIGLLTEHGELHEHLSYYYGIWFRMVQHLGAEED